MPSLSFLLELRPLPCPGLIPLYRSRSTLYSLSCCCRIYLVGVKEGRSLKPGTALPASLLKGDIGPLTDQVSWRLHNRDYRAAAALLYSMLMWNADAMDYDPSLLPRPEKLTKHQAFFKVSPASESSLCSRNYAFHIFRPSSSFPPPTLPSTPLPDPALCLPAGRRPCLCTWPCSATCSSGRAGGSSRANTSSSSPRS